MRICLVDDETTQIELLKNLINKWSNMNDVETEISFYSSSEEMLFECEYRYPFDLIILDIQMGEMDGISLAKTIRKTDGNVTIAFISGMKDYVYEGYEVEAVRYILKPVNDVKVYELLDFVYERIIEEPKYLIVSTSGSKNKVKYDDIVYIEAMGHYITIYTVNEDISYKYSISELYNELCDFGFTKTHRSYIVNLKHVDKITREYCLLSNKQEIPLSRSLYKEVNEKFIEYYKGKGV